MRPKYDLNQILSHSLISQSVLITAIRTLPSNTVTSHAPGVFIQTGLAYPKTAAALPAKRHRPPATMADTDTIFTPPGGSAARFIRRIWHALS
ncbi:hypothetical protein QUF75_06820 [Desulfococcaceae bacterium HSG7]|nr:hypothetical protein [Desulfococcaceae bacterium HSG7]